MGAREKGLSPPGRCQDKALSAQLSCLARLLTARNLTADFRSYPPDLLLFLE